MTIFICNECDKPINLNFNDNIFCHCQPERSKREDLEIDCFRESDEVKILSPEWKINLINKTQGCGALNTMET